MSFLVPMVTALLALLSSAASASTAASDTISSHELVYFDFPGRAEAIRVALSAAGIDFTDTRLSFDEFRAAKQAGKYPTGVPVLKIGDGISEHTQSLAILRYAGKLARKTKESATLYPEDPVEAMVIDRAMDIIQDVAAKCPQTSGNDDDEKKRLREEYAAGPMHRFCSELESMINSSGGPFLTGADLTVADLHLAFFLAGGISSGSWDFIPKNYLTNQFPKLEAVEMAVKEHPIVVSYSEKNGAIKSEL